MSLDNGFDQLVLNANASLAFTGFLFGSGTDHTNNFGLWAAVPHQPLRPAARTGQAAPQLRRRLRAKPRLQGATQGAQEVAVSLWRKWRKRMGIEPTLAEHSPAEQRF